MDSLTLRTVMFTSLAAGLLAITANLSRRRERIPVPDPPVRDAVIPEDAALELLGAALEARRAGAMITPSGEPAARSPEGLTALARAIDARDPSTHLHSARVAELTHALALVGGWSREAASEPREAGLMHDVGKIGVPDAIPAKEGPLSAAD